MKLSKNILISLTALSVSACQNHPNAAPSATPNTTPITKKALQHIIFGMYCGECGSNCSTMYKLDVVNDKLQVDHTDSYWERRNGKPMQFAEDITDENEKKIAKQLIDSLPIFLEAASKPDPDFGCPDCTDGCGLFLEVKEDSLVKVFHIDAQIGQLKGDIKRFAGYLKNLIREL